MQRYSKKRQAILDCLTGTTEHPSADRIYEKLKPVYPDLSLATVYRNLLQLEEEGLIRSVGIVDGQKRYDANVSPHTHAVCRVCGKVIDVFSVPVPPGLAADVENKTGFSVEVSELRFSGVCGDCIKKINEEKSHG